MGERGAEGLRIELQSLDADFEPIVPVPDYEDEVAVIAEFVEVLRPPT